MAKAAAKMLNGEVREFEVNKDIRPVPGRYILFQNKIYYAKDSSGVDKEYKLELIRGEEKLTLTSEYLKAYARVVVEHEGIIEL
jgi:hypothetical protein